jgi:Lrp/AsnC family transcriptional regulator for asnA, asnC and gidA
MIDELDKKIIKLLVKDGRKSSKELSKELHVDSSTIRRRVHRLIEEGVIYIIALPVVGKAGFPVQAIIGLNIDNMELDNNLKIISEIPECMFVSVTTGKFNVMIILWCSSTAEIHKLIKIILSNIKGVNSYETFICMNIAKSVDRLYLNAPTIGSTF